MGGAACNDRAFIAEFEGCRPSFALVPRAPCEYTDDAYDPKVESPAERRICNGLSLED